LENIGECIVIGMTVQIDSMCSAYDRDIVECIVDGIDHLESLIGIVEYLIAADGIAAGETLQQKSDIIIRQLIRSDHIGSGIGERYAYSIRIVGDDAIGYRASGDVKKIYTIGFDSLDIRIVDCDIARIERHDTIIGDVHSSVEFHSIDDDILDAG
jgi:hypothetical protein